MTNEEKLFERYSKLAYVSGNELYFEKQIAFDYLKDCTELNIAVIGVDFYYIKEGKILPVTLLMG